MKASDLKSLKSALRALDSDHVRDNQFRLGALGASDVNHARNVLKHMIARVEKEKGAANER